ncbi:MAG: GNAT family N-acetyltransferase [Kiloniellales bacterium]|nr:GNAT family N-acetyltransferase [Kiloniellales bacterium]
MTTEDDELPDLKIRPAEPADDRALLALWQAGGVLAEGDDPLADLRNFRAAADAEVLVGQHRGKVVAGLCVAFDGGRGSIYNLAVDAELRGDGYGRRMLRFAERWLKKRGAESAQVLIPAGRLEARRFCEHLDYTTEPRHIMRRRLVAGAAAPEGLASENPGEGKLAVTVTYLEMTERPSLPQVLHPAETTIALLRAHNPPVPFYRFLYDTVGGPWLWYERRVMAEADLARILEDERVEVYVLYAEGAPAGFAELDRRQGTEIELSYFGMMPFFIGRGLGRYLLAWAIERAWSYEPRRLLVNTCDLDHPKALPLYQQLGFKPYKQEEKVIDDPRVTGVIPV